MDLENSQSKTYLGLTQREGHQDKDFGTMQKCDGHSTSKNSNDLRKANSQDKLRDKKNREQLASVQQNARPLDDNKLTVELELPKGASKLEPLLRERSFRQSLNAEKKIMSDMLEQRSRAMQAAANRNPITEMYKSAAKKSVFGSMQLPIKSSTTECSEAQGASNDDNKASAPHKEDIHKRERAFTMPSYFSAMTAKERYPPCYWLTCTYKLLTDENCLHLVVRQTGTLPKLEGKLSAKFFIENEKKVHTIVLAESSSDTSFRSHELLFPNQSETVGKVLVFRLYDIKNVFNKVCIGDRRISLDDCSEKPKIVCEKFR